MERLSPSQRMSEGHHRPRSRRPRGGGVTGGQDGLSENGGEHGLTAQARHPPHCHATRSPRRAPLPSAPGGTSRRPQRPSARRKGRRAPGSPRRPFPRTRPLRGPRCRKRRKSTSWHFLQSSCPLDAAAMLKRTGETDGNASRGFSGQVSGIWCRCRRSANRDVRRPGALRRTRLGWRSDRSPRQECRAHAPRLGRNDSGRRRSRRIRKTKN